MHDVLTSCWNFLKNQVWEVRRKWKVAFWWLFLSESQNNNNGSFLCRTKLSLVYITQISVWIAVAGGGLTLPQLTRSQIIYLEVRYMLYAYNLHHNFGRTSTVEKFNPPANFSQFKHCHKTAQMCFIRTTYFRTLINSH